MSWRHFITTPTTQNESSASLRQPHLRPSNVDGVTATPASALAPLDEHNIALLDKVHPPQWSNPNAKPLYDLVVIGAGAGGLVTSAAASGVGAKVALIEKHLMGTPTVGGDCLNVGCVPSKALLKAAKTAHTLRKAIDDEAELGVSLEGSVKVDFEKVMLRVRRLRAEIADADSVSRFADKLGVDVFLGAGQFVDRNTVVVNGQELRFIKCVIATGGSPALPDIPGLQAAYANQTQSQPVILTNENLFNRTVLPPRLAVIGAGAIGMEMAQAFERLGSKVTVLARSGRILPKEDRDVADLIQTCLHKEGIDFQLDVAKYTNVVATEDVVTLSFSTHGGVQQQLEVDAVLVAAGRRPNVGSLNCEAADVKYDAVNGIQVNDRLQSSNDAIFAVGDVCSRYQFTHASDFMARMVVRNTLFFGGDKFSNLLIPWSTYTSPEVAHVGAYAEDLDAQEVAYDVYEKRLDSNDRCILEGETEGLIRIVCKRGSDKIIGATIVGPNAGDMISEITLAMQAEVGLGTLASVIHPYPTRADAIRALGDQYNRTRLTPMVRRLLRGVVRFHRTGRSASK
ncbi:uncharacterized protein MONBRDRAFT_18328 [Monosiga brevicollis MX1]|uniref:Mercuric reductase n=1 Tax=Monosiga brevicollis TaxID=81824 RepID=A9UUE3_MONBE|nr:uncharacterized protein MONBRDRAFT_18328 [Monosiga brevicollis MX1]EDQ90887.1 predicted protein [Monosiga brevicollis MX1]|eukprot:XP_001744184.1 hypothetical protein [Monosiga brevicollis MX1]